MEVLRLLEEMEDILEASSGFGKRRVVNKGELLEIIKEIRIKLPDEIKTAQWIKDEKQRILTEAKNDAHGLMEDAEARVKELVEKDQITREAEVRAEAILDEAREAAEDILYQTYEYTDEMLSSVEKKLQQMNEILSDNRAELRGMLDQFDREE